MTASKKSKLSSANSTLARRNFLKSATGVAVSLGVAPTFIPSTVFGANERITTGHIGTGGRGLGKLNDYMQHAIAVCDVDKTHLAEAVKQCQDAGRKVDAAGDYRRLLDRKDIDAIVIATPDHWHAKTTIDAVQAGKDVFCEKPLSLTIAEGRAMVNAARENNRIVQTGTQQRSDANFRKSVEIARSGKLGRLKEILVGIPNVRYRGKKTADSAPPPELDYNFWLGPAPERTYNAGRVHYNFRYFRDYSGGQMTNWGAHHLDIAQWALDADQSGPLTVEGWGKFEGNGLYDVSTECRATLNFAGGTKVIVGQLQDDIPLGLTFVYDQGRLIVDRDAFISDPVDLLSELKDLRVESVAISDNHDQNFLECIKTRELPISDIESGHRTASLCHLANIAIELGREIKWDAKAENFGSDEAANAKLERPYRAPWKLV
jgi:predicted dehydrogenase